MKREHRNEGEETCRKVLILAFDALEETLVDRWAAEGHLPTFAKLGGRAATHPLDNTVTYLPDTLWAELTTGKSAPAAGLYWAARAGARRRGAAAGQPSGRLRPAAVLAAREFNQMTGELTYDS